MLFLAIGILVFSLLVWIYTILTCEKTVSNALDATQPAPKGVTIALQSCGGRFSAGLPEVLVFPETIPEARVARALGRPGVIFLSQGLVAMFRDEELTAILRGASTCLSQRGVVFKSACFAWRTRLNPNPLEQLTPSRALAFWTFLPLIRLLESQEQALDVFRRALIESVDPDQITAMHKASKTRRIFS